MSRTFKRAVKKGFYKNPMNNNITLKFFDFSTSSFAIELNMSSKTSKYSNSLRFLQVKDIT